MDYQFRPIEKWPGSMTKDRRYSPFRAGYSATLEFLDTELAKINARNVVIQIALAPGDIRNDGRPRADAKPVSHPGVILSFEKWTPNGQRNERGPLGVWRPYSMPCDTFTNWHDNLRAIALTLESLRKIERYGVAQSSEQYTGWAALPAPSETMDLRGAAGFVAMHCQSAATESLIINDGAAAKNAYRAAAKRLHPDNGGDAALFNDLQRAWAILQQHHGA